jgi:RNA polymerase sigma factor (sigma-70 family)
MRDSRRVPDATTTRWSLVFAARGAGADGRAALGELCEHYRPVVIGFFRRHGSPQLAEDRAQAFFLHFLESGLHARADAGRGSFRAFLYTALRNHWHEAMRTESAQKRHAGIEAGEDALAGLASTEAGPERQFDRDWALTVFQRAQARLQAEVERSGKAALYAAVQEFLLEAPEPSDYTRIGAALAMPPNTVAVAVRRLRERLRALVRAELADTLPPTSDVAAELEWLRSSLRDAGNETLS